MRNGYRSELHPLLLVVFASVTYTFALAALTIVTAPSPQIVGGLISGLPRLRLGRAFSVFLIASFSRWVFFVLVNLSFLLVAVAGYFIGQRGAILDHNTIAAVLETTTPEASEFVWYKLLLTVADRSRTWSYRDGRLRKILST